MGTTTTTTTLSFALQQQSKSSVLVLGLAMAALALSLSAQTAEGALAFLNKLEYGLILYHPPGCCSPFGFFPPPPGYGCGRCPLVYLAPNVTKTLDPIVGPYPLQFLQIIGMGPKFTGKTFCVMGMQLNATNTMTIGPNECHRGIETQITETGKTTESVPTYCMKRCIG